MSLLRDIFFEKSKEDVESKQLEVKKQENVQIRFQHPQESMPIISPIQNTPVQAKIPDPKIEGLFKNFLDEINKPGFDFLEFYNLVKDYTTQQEYQIIVNTLKATGTAVDKTSLLNDVDFYLQKIESQINDLTKNGDIKKKTLTEQLANSSTQINSEIVSLQTQMNSLESKIIALKTQRDNLSPEIQSQIREIDETLLTLQHYKQEFNNKIESTKQKIIQYL
jgi:hypothetical protein